jgi:hypothetical protein
MNCIFSIWLPTGMGYAHLKWSNLATTTEQENNVAEFYVANYMREYKLILFISSHPFSH